MTLSYMTTCPVCDNPVICDGPEIFPHLRKVSINGITNLIKCPGSNRIVPYEKLILLPIEDAVVK